METSSKNRLRADPSFRLDINLETDNPCKRIVRLFAHLQDVLTDVAASDEFYSIIRLSTEFIPETDYPSVTYNPSRRIIRL